MHCKRIAASAALLVSSSMLSGCLFQPGTFDATLHVMADRQFTFEYRGEIVMAGLMQLAEMAEEAEEEPCQDDETGMERPCTADEIAERERKDAMGREMMRGMLGDIDLSDEEEIAEMTAMLERQAGWNSVEFVEEGVFMVDYAISSTLGHDYDFPTFEDMPMSNAFVSVRLRDDGRAHISAPGFAPGAGNPLAAMMMGMAGAFAGAGDESQSEGPEMPLRPIDGTFRIITDATILTNNTDEGPVADPRGSVLEWDIDADMPAAPTALIAFPR